MSEFNFGKNIEKNNNETNPVNPETKKPIEKTPAEYIPNDYENIQKELELARQNAQTIIDHDPLKDDQVKVYKKNKDNSDWFLDVPAEKRVETSFTLIQSKQKKLSSVVFAFLHHGDFAGLDDLEKVLSKNYNDLVESDVLKKI